MILTGTLTPFPSLARGISNAEHHLHDRQQGYCKSILVITIVMVTFGDLVLMVLRLCLEDWDKIQE